MANNHGSKFVSVNLNKLYGQPSHLNYHSHTGSYGPPGAGPNRARPTSAGGGGGGMVVLSRNRPLQKAMPKLSVPAPLNLPSLRKEYEKTDSSGAGGGGPGAAGSGTGSRPSSSGMGWTKPGNIALQEKEVASDTLVSENVNYSSAKGSGAYMPPSARFGGGDTPSANHSLVEKAMVLRGEDFPSLRAALPSSSAPAQKQKEGSLQPVKKFVSEESSNDVRDAYHFHAPAPMQSSHRMANDVNESPRPNRARLDHALKQEDPLSFLRLNPRSDWADDERDTGHRFAGRDQDLPKSEVYWDRDLDVPRSSILPQKPSSNISERKGVTSQALKAEPYRETNSWRSSIHKERPTGAHAISDGTVTNHFSNSNTHHGVVTENRDPAFLRRDTGQGRHWNHNVEYSKSRNESYQNSTGSKSVFSLGGKSSFSKSEQTYLDDSFQKDFSSSVYDERDPLTGNFVGVMKRKKGVIEQTAFHDPVRESFEAELERVQKMQEMERQRAVEEQERALEHARREDEERRRVILEEEERRRRMEEEAKEAAWRAEQERLDAIQKAEEQKIAREEEKRRMLLEEERRKQAAKQKLLDLEARMAKRGAEVRKSGPGTRRMNNESKPEKETLITKTQTASSSAESNQKRDILEEDIDAPLQSGVVRVFKQPGIECLSDEDDFIEVRSKRQMLNERREQREKEIKQPRKARVTSTGHKNKLSASLAGEPSNNNRPDVGLVKKEHTVDFSTMASQPVAPIGTATVDTDVQTEIRLHTSKTLQRGSALSGAAADHDSNLTSQTESKVEENVQTSLGDWGNARSDQQVPLTQIQLDEAMKPLSFNTTHIPSIGDHTTLVNEPILSSSSILTAGKSVSSSSSPINSLLAGEKIQFGAVTSPTILAPSSCVVSHGIGAFRSDVTQTTQNITKAENDGNVFTSKDAHPTEDCKAEVEASVAAIDTDEIVSNGLRRVSVSGTENFGGAVEGVQGGLGGDQQSGSQSKPEESLSVSLPADLSVDTPPISLWPPLPSPQGSSPQMLSHYHGPTPSHFPFYDMNHPMMSAPVFAFGSPDESGGTQPQSQKPTGSAGSRHIGAWQNHSGMDSFYGPPAGFTGPFIGSPGGIPGVQAPPHMVVYNHYSPVGQFGQVGLSFMGATYIPSGKQPDWKHDPTSSTRNEDGMSSMNMVSGPRNPPNMQQPPVQQHLAPGSPLLPMGSPLTMFDVPPFQTAPDMSVQARWSHVPASSLHAVPMPPPLQQQAKVMTGPSQFSSHGGGHPVDQSTFPPNRLSEPQASGPSVVSPVVRDSTITHFPDDLGLLDSSGRPSISTTYSPVTLSHNSSATAKIGEGGGVELKNQHQQDKNKNSNNNNNHGGGYGYQRGGGLSPKNKSMWSHRRIGRYMGAEKSFPSTTKVKQIYVAKQPTGSSSTVG
ncbi:hypothetical protein HanPI659440_Chr14g0559291 [Helianthus annuus]|nr:hypothetical protein HanPI659440_Chr14g0559291 [Helianthus annuus]